MRKYKIVVDGCADIYTGQLTGKTVIGFIKKQTEIGAFAQRVVNKIQGNNARIDVEGHIYFFKRDPGDIDVFHMSLIIGEVFQTCLYQESLRQGGRSE